MKKTLFISALPAILCMNSSTFADEVWDSTVGTVIYADDIGPTAMWTYSLKDIPGVIYILGLAGNYDNRGAYEGYWAQATSDQRCDTPRLGPNKTATYYWGRFHIHFMDKAFPSRWTAKLGFCDGVPTQGLDGKPVTQ